MPRFAELPPHMAPSFPSFLVRSLDLCDLGNRSLLKKPGHQADTFVGWPLGRRYDELRAAQDPRGRNGGRKAVDDEKVFSEEGDQIVISYGDLCDGAHTEASAAMEVLG
jgi:hypothetical protein